MAVTGIITVLGLLGIIPGTFADSLYGSLIERVEALENRLQLSERNIVTLQETVQEKEESIQTLKAHLQQADTNDNSLVIRQQQTQLDELSMKVQLQQEELDKHSLIIQQQQTLLGQQNLKIQQQQERLHQQDMKIQQQQEQLDQQEMKIQQQETQLDQQYHELEQQTQKILNLEAEFEKYNLDDIEDRIGKDNQSTVDTNDKPDNDRNITDREINARKIFGISRRQVEGGGIAFTAYLDHDVELGTDQIIQFNQIITNEAGGYNVHSGTFICPESGLYLFSFSVGQRDPSHQIWAHLRVNDVILTSATAETMANTEDDQGSSTVVIRLTIGDTVWVSGLEGHHIEGDPGFRITTFTGVYLYP